jgi:hypothetical protein
VVQEKCDFIKVQEQQVTKIFKRIFLDDIDCIQNVRKVREVPEIAVPLLVAAPWKWYFELKTHKRIFLLFACTDEELDLWVSGLSRILGI